MLEPKLTDDELKNIVLAFSEARMEPYLNAAHSNHSDAIRIYEINIQLCEALYPSLHTIEITLRNTIDYVLSDTYGEEWFRNERIPLASYEQESVNAAITKCKYNLKKLMPELNFGFWVSLIKNKSYEERIWTPCCKKIFKKARSYELNIKKIRPNITAIHRVRNIAFHHEPIWKYEQLDDVHRDIYCLLNWINPEIGDWIREYDRFPEVYETTSKQLELMNVARNKNIKKIHLC